MKMQPINIVPPSDNGSAVFTRCREVVSIRPKVVALVGVLLLMSAAGCAAPAPSPSAPTPSARSAPPAAVTAAQSGTAGISTGQSPSTTAPTASSTLTSPQPTATAEMVPWNPAGVRVVTETAPAAPTTPAPSNLRVCDGAELRLLPASARTAPTFEDWLITRFVLQDTGSSPCSMSPGYFSVTMISADGATLPLDGMPAGGGRWSPMQIRPHQLAFGSIWWAVNEGNPRPTHLTFDLGDTPSAQPVSIVVAGVSIPPHPSSPDPQSPWRSTAYGEMISTADPGTLATLTVGVTTPATVRVPSTLRYAVTLTNPTTTGVPLTGCPQFVQQLSVVPLKYPTTVGAQGPLNCAHLPLTIAANSSVTLQMELDTTGQIPGPGQLTWQLLDHGHEAAARITEITVQRG